MVWVSSQSDLAWSLESTFGTAATPDRFLGIMNSGVALPDLQQDLKEYNNIGTGRRRFTIVEGRDEYGPATIDFIPTTGAAFYPVFGTEAFEADTPTTGVNAHTMTPDDKGDLPSGATTTSNATELPSFTLAVELEGSPNFRRDFVGTVVESCNVSLTENAELSMSWDVRAQDVENEGDASPTSLSTPSNDDSGGTPTPYLFYDRGANIHLGGSFTYTGPTYSSADLGYSGGRTWANVKSFSWSINNNLKPLYFTRDSNAKKVAKYVTSNPDFSLSMEIVPDAQLSSSDEDAVYDMLENGTEGDILIPFQRADNEELHFVFEDAHIRSASHDLGEEGDEVSVSVEAAVEEVRVVSIDGIAAYNGL